MRGTEDAGSASFYIEDLQLAFWNCGRTKKKDLKESSDTSEIRGDKFYSNKFFIMSPSDFGVFLKKTITILRGKTSLFL